MQHPASPRTLVVDHFDGHSAKPRRVVISLEDQSLVVQVAADGQALLRCPESAVTWPERTRHGARIAQLPDGASLHALDTAAWDDWRASQGRRSSLVVHAQLSWLAALLAVVLVGVSLWAGYQWGLPWAAKGVVALTPRSVDTALGQVAVDSLDDRWFQPSELPPERQKALTQAFDQAAQRARLARCLSQEAAETSFKVVFRKSRIGPNALAFPDGTIVITDDLVKLLAGKDEVLTGVFAHEWGHLQHRHSMRLLVQVGALSAAASAVLGDFSSLAAAAPALMGQMAYSRELEREADDTAIAVLQASRIPPAVMVALFQKLAAAKNGTHGNETARHPQPEGTESDEAPGISFSSHPSEAERIERFKNAPLSPQRLADEP
jgi:Zn-dependent protease with chaperone function